MRRQVLALGLVVLAGSASFQVQVTFQHNGSMERPTIVSGGVIKELLA